MARAQPVHTRCTDVTSSAIAHTIEDSKIVEAKTAGGSAQTDGEGLTQGGNLQVPIPPFRAEAVVLYRLLFWYRHMFDTATEKTRAEWRETYINNYVTGMLPRPHLPTGISRSSSFLIPPQKIVSDYRFEMPVVTLVLPGYQDGGGDWN